MRITPTYTDEFRADALRLVARGQRSVAGIAVDLGVNEWTLREWIKKDRMRQKKKAAAKTAPLTPETMTPEQKLAWLEHENVRLQQEVAQLRMDREILKKAAAFFAKESG
jgi:transposase